jgi:hypothetical protein
LAKVPVRIVTTGANVSGGLGHRSLGPGAALVLEDVYGKTNISGGVVPMTFAEFSAASGSQAIASLSPAAWYQYGQGITVTGAGVSQWSDASGNARHLMQGTDTNRPTKNADGSILFDGVDNYLETAGFVLAAPYSIYLLFKQVTWTSGDYVFNGLAANTPAASQATATPGVNFFGGASAIGPINGPAIGSYGVMCMTNSAGTGSIQTNAGAPTTGAVGSTAWDGLRIATSTGITAWGNIEVKEVILFGAAHSTATRADVIAYLNRVGGL